MESLETNIVVLDRFYGDTLERLGICRYFFNKTRIDADRFILKYAETIEIFIVGSNPSNKSPGLHAFDKSTKSRKTIDKWFEDYCDFKYHLSFSNVFNRKTQNNVQPTKKHIDDYIYTKRALFKGLSKDKCIVAVGKTAQYALDQMGVEHFKMPHPSGLNRFWNDPEASEAKIKEMMEYIKQANETKKRVRKAFLC